MFKVAAIIPCAGYGTRMGMASHESKEMLYLNGENVPVINYSLDLCNKYNLKPVVISRPEKKEFNKYIENWGATLLMYTPEEGDEWPDTVLASESAWEERNVLILPDTRFNPSEAVYQVAEALNYHPMVAATHHVPDGEKWGCLFTSSMSGFDIIEKPKGQKESSAWGLLGWQKNKGCEFFTNITIYGRSHFWGSVLPLTSFKDITRPEDRS